jgi:hypothetical protein
MKKVPHHMKQRRSKRKTKKKNHYRRYAAGRREGIVDPKELGPCVLEAWVTGLSLDVLPLRRTLETMQVWMVEPKRGLTKLTNQVDTLQNTVIDLVPRPRQRLRLGR